MKVENGETLPAIQAEFEGSAVDLAQLVSGSWGVVLLYRGHW
ncbi:MAG: hypothetical protein ACR2QK_03965 [Acidimicrobiales bacterium]